jgi:predicted metalloprotease
MGGMALPIGGVGGIAGLIFLVIQLIGGGGGGINVPGLEPFGAAPAEPDGTLNGAPDPDAELVDFLGFVESDVQGAWDELFSSAGRTYEPADLVLFDEATQTGCGVGSAQTGPFYCPADNQVYLDLDFFRELRDRFGAPGDFAQAYVIAHEYGHHVQTLLGIEREVRQAQQSDSDRANELSIKMELQADCFAGVWGHSAYDDRLLETGDLEEGLAAAEAIGDDRIQKSTTGRVNPESWTHGSSAQRMEWFRRGFDSGAPEDCDTFS